MESLRSLPSVDQVLRRLKHLHQFPQALLTAEVRAVLAEHRHALTTGTQAAEATVEQAVEKRLQHLLRRSLKPVINATGVILHTNLGRAPLAEFQPIRRYSNLEYDLETGKRGKRDVHTARLLQRLLGTTAIIVNNNAAAVFLVLHELAAGQEVIVSRGELIEIGDGFRIPEIMARSGALLREVGTTNRTHIDDYRQAIGERTRLILRVHPSNFHMSGFTARPDLRELTELGKQRAIPVYEDLGGGCLVDLRAQGINEPLVTESLAAGVNVVSFSCDKLLGGPQSGIIAGETSTVERIRRNPLYRALRVDKLIIESLETTLRHLLLKNWKAIPSLEMILAPVDEIHQRAERFAAKLESFDVTMQQNESAIGGGATPDQTLPTWVVELNAGEPNAFESRLRKGATPVIARIERDRIIFDMRTVADEEVDALVSAIRAASHFF